MIESESEGVASSCATLHAMRGPGSSRSNTTPGRNQPRSETDVHIGHRRNLLPNCPDRCSFCAPILHPIARSDLLTGSGSRLDIHFKSVRNKLLESCKEPVIVAALWTIRPDPESVRIKKKGGFFLGWHKIPARSSHGILQEVQSLLQKYRSELVRQSRFLDQGDPA